MDLVKKAWAVILNNLSKGHQEAVLHGTFVQGDIGRVDLVKEVLTKRRSSHYSFGCR